MKSSKRQHRFPAGLIALGAAAALVLSACGRDSGGGAGAKYSDPGISDDSITIGSSVPLSGPASAYGVVSQVHKAYFKYVNDELGGIDGRKVNYVAYDDGYDPARTVENARRLVEKDKAFAVFGVIGTPTNLAVWDYLNQQKVPQLFVGSAETKLSSDPNHPLTMAVLPAFTTEAAIMTADVLKNNPHPKVAILYQNDDFGHGILSAFERAFSGTAVELVGKQSYDVTDPTVDSQVVNLKASGADVFIAWTNPKQAAQAIKKAHEIDWKPSIYISSAATSIESVLKPAGLDAAKGVRSTFYSKDPSDAQWQSDKGFQEYKRILEKYGSGINVSDQIAALGYSQVQLIVAALKGMRTPTRQGLMDSATALAGVQLGMLLPGITATTAKDDHFAIETEQVQSFDGSRWQPVGAPVSMEGKTPAAK